MPSSACQPFLSDANPQRVMFNIDPDPEGARASYRDLSRRWDEIRVPLSELSTGHPLETVRRLATELVTA
ncbi:MAG: hypothetical protein ACRERD_14625, partial [Candidatus Binatia bacterium]